MKTNRLTTLLASLAAVIFLAAFVTSSALAQSVAHVMENAGTAKWGPAPPMLPPGAQIAVLAGDPGKSAPYTVRLKFPANYDIPAHSHPTDENVVVVSGELFMGMGDKLDRKTGLGLGVGGFGLMPAGANHFAYTRAETTIVLYGQGPVEFKYVNPADDPRTAPTTRK
jgi:quercetin dioxygenase-like cupin family protein